MNFDYSRLLNILSLLVLGHHDILVIPIFYQYPIEIEMRDMPPLPISFRCKYLNTDCVLS